MKPFRSLLILPGDDDLSMGEGVSSAADGIVFDLEDLVLAQNTAKARLLTSAKVAELRTGGDKRTLIVRVNDRESGLAGYDLESTVQPGLDGIMLTKTRNRDDIVWFDALVSEYEQRNGVEVGSLKFIVPGETAEALESCSDLVSHPRVFSMIGAATRGDVAHAIGYEWHASGLETLYFRSRVLLASRAAGITHPISGAWESEHDIDGLIQDAEAARRIGYRAYLILHAAHAEVVNDVFTPSEEDLARYRSMISEYRSAVERGESVFSFEGRFTDLAHIKTAQEVLDYAALFAVDSGS